MNRGRDARIDEWIDEWIYPHEEIFFSFIYQPTYSN